MRTAINPITARMVQIMFGHLLLFRLSYDLVLPSVYPLTQGFTHALVTSGDGVTA